MERLRQRADFVAAASGIKSSTDAFVLQVRSRRDARPARFGFTVTKRIGNAPERNRVRRRLRAIVMRADVHLAQAGFDYVLVGRRAALDLPFPRLVADFQGAVRRAHGASRPGSASPRSDRRTPPRPRETPQ